MPRLEICSLVLLLSLLGQFANADIVINEFVYDDGSTDDREFVELYNNGAVAVDISGWTVGGRDAGGANTVATIPAATSIAAGGYYVLANTGVPNLNQTVAGGFFENDAESIEVWNGAFGTSTLVDGVVYEGYRGTASHGVLSAAMTTQVGGETYWGTHNAPDAGAGLTRTSLGRYVDGVDTNNNGRDYGQLVPTPGANNVTASMTHYEAPNVDALSDGASAPGLTGSFVNGRVITPGVVVDNLNENAIPAPPISAKAITAWDGSGGGNAVFSNASYTGGAQSFLITAYIDTANMPLNSNTVPVTFRGSEFSWFGLAGSIDGLAGVGTQLTNVSGAAGIGALDSALGVTGVAWYYEKIGETATGNGIVSEHLYLIDAGDGGNHNADPGNATADEWIILADFDLSSTPSDWYELGISIDAAGNGLATFDTNLVPFTTSPGLLGQFYVGYRENTQIGANGTPTFLRPPTFAVIPEPGAFLFGGLICGVIVLGVAGRNLAAKLTSRG